MRKIKLQVQISVDGFIAGLNGEQDWMTWNWDDSLKKYVTDLTNGVDTMLIGRVTYQGMAEYWPAALKDPDGHHTTPEFAAKMNNMPKIVFSDTLSDVEWKNSTLVRKANLETEVKKMKTQPGKDIVIYGGAGAITSLIQLNLIDEYHLFVNPVILGAGKPIFAGLKERMKLELIRSVETSCGIVVLCYKPAKN